MFGDYKLTEDERQTIKAGISLLYNTIRTPDRKSFTGIKIDDNDNFISIRKQLYTSQYLEFKGNSYISGLLEYNLKFGNEDKEIT